MTRYAALLGSINVGSNRLKMADLKTALTADGLANVTTVAASGNVLFDCADSVAASLEQRIASVIQMRFGIDTFAVVRTQAELKAALAESPFAEEGEDRFVHVHFLETQPPVEAFTALGAAHEGRGAERLAPGTRCLHIDFVSGVGTSKLTSPFIARQLGCRGTARNIRSLRRIIEMMDQ